MPLVFWGSVSVGQDGLGTALGKKPNKGFTNNQAGPIRNGLDDFL
jgi:hypothetical protein